MKLLKSFWFNWINNNNKNNKNGIQPTFSLLVSTSRELVETIHYVLNDSSKIDSMLSLGDYDYTLHSLELLLHKKCKGCHTLLIKLYYFNWIEIVVIRLLIKNVFNQLWLILCNITLLTTPY